MNAFVEVMKSLRVSGLILLVDSYKPPWAISIPDGETLKARLGATKDTRVVLFHLVRRGAFELHTQTDTPLVVRAGEVVICAGGQSHMMVQGVAGKIIPFTDLLANRDSSINARNTPGATELLCGVFMLRDTPHNPLINGLPSILHMDVSGRTGSKTLEAVADLLVDELQAARVGSSYMAARLVELFYAESIRGHMDKYEANQPGWFKALAEPKIATALDAFHAAPHMPWSVASLASVAGMSGSRFAAKFREVLGIAPMSYVSGWRMNIAARLLIDTMLSIAEIAERVGYESMAAFSRAFSKHFETPPAQWRKSEKQSLTGTVALIL